ncbi:MAG: glycosyltransferase family 2 protein [Nitrososphaera sp.]|nr:glycosyltransferase family 2 protein [Nitrososphaera sp.]
MSISILILTLNEEVNLPECLNTVRWSDDIVVLDSLSTDGTVAIAEATGARVVQRKFDNWSSHQNWALENISFRHEWVFYIDADERMTEELKEELLREAKKDGNKNVAYFCGRRNFFMGKWIKHAMPPSYIMRFFRPRWVRFERLVNPTPVIDGPHGYLKNYLDHYNFSKGITEWISKHNRYSLLEAEEGTKIAQGFDMRSLLATDSFHRRKSLKNLSFRLPLRPWLKFTYLYLIKRGFLDGTPGLTYCTLSSIYEYFIVLKTRELQWRKKSYLQKNENRAR